MKRCDVSWRVVMIYEELWWCVNYCDDLWRVVRIYEELCWFVNYCYDLWSVVMIYEELWYLVNYCDDLWKAVIIYLFIFPHIVLDIAYYFNFLHFRHFPFTHFRSLFICIYFPWCFLEPMIMEHILVILKCVVRSFCFCVFVLSLLAAFSCCSFCAEYVLSVSSMSYDSYYA